MTDGLWFPVGGEREGRIQSIEKIRQGAQLGCRLTVTSFRKKGGRQGEYQREVHGVGRICTSHFRGWQIYVDTLLDCGVYRIQCTPYQHTVFLVIPHT
jgi:hypothetical protein